VKFSRNPGGRNSSFQILKNPFHQGAEADDFLLPFPVGEEFIKPVFLPSAIISNAMAACPSKEMEGHNPKRAETPSKRRPQEEVRGQFIFRSICCRMTRTFSPPVRSPGWPG